MTNILIDGNYIMHKTFGIFAGYGKNIDPGKILADKKDQSAFVRKIATDLCSSLKMLPGGGRLIFTSDSRSWRKEVEIENGGYKSGRIKDENVDWSIFFDLLSSFGHQLEKMGFVFSKVEGAEGDDLLLFWSAKFNEMGENCIIITGDRDLHQLARYENGSWTAVWNNNSKNNLFTVPIGWSPNPIQSQKEVSIFNMEFSLSPESDKLQEFIKKVKVTEVEHKSLLFKKILTGDSGDSVPSVWEFESKGKMNRFTEKKAEDVYSIFSTSDWKDLEIQDLLTSEDFLSWASGLVLKISKGVDSSENRDKVKKNIIRNHKLVCLNPQVIPENIRGACYLEIERGMGLEKRTVTLDRIKILDGTEWVTPGYQPKGFDPFEDLLK